MFKDLHINLSYFVGQFTSILLQNSFSIGENSVDNKNNSCRKPTQESLEFNKLQKDFKKLNVFYKKLK